MWFLYVLFYERMFLWFIKLDIFLGCRGFSILRILIIDCKLVLNCKIFFFLFFGFNCWVNLYVCLVIGYSLYVIINFMIIWWLLILLRLYLKWFE